MRFLNLLNNCLQPTSITAGSGPSHKLNPKCSWPRYRHHNPALVPLNEPLHLSRLQGECPWN